MYLRLIVVSNADNHYCYIIVVMCSISFSKCNTLICIVLHYTQRVKKTIFYCSAHLNSNVLKCFNCNVTNCHVWMHMKGLQITIQSDCHMNIDVTKSETDSYFEVVTSCNTSIIKRGNVLANERISMQR